MQISSRFTIAVHILTDVVVLGRDRKVTSSLLAGSANVNAVIIRNILGQLKAAGIVEVRRGAGGTTLARPAEEVTLLDVYRAVGSVTREEGLFHFHEAPNPDCEVGRNIHKVLDCRIERAQKALEDELASSTVADAVADALALIAAQDGTGAGAGRRADVSKRADEEGDAR